MALNQPSIQPSPPIQFNFKKQREAAAQDIILDSKYEVTSSITTYNVPNWLSIIYLSKDGNLYDYRLSIKSSIANALSPGTYSQEVQFRFRAQVHPAVGADVTVKFHVNLTVVDTIRLSLSPTVLNYTYTIGGQPPPLNFLNVTTENPWELSKDQSWITVNKVSGNGNGTIEVGANVAGLSAGNYSGTIQIDDGYDRKNATVNLQVKATNTAEDYLTLTPGTINVVVNQGQAGTIQKSFEVSNSDTITIISDQPWANPAVDEMTAHPGRTLYVQISQTHTLPTGTYVANITVESSYSTVVGQIVLTVNETILDGVVNNGFYYADDRNEIKLNSQIPNSELKLEFSTTVGNDLSTYPKVAPFFKGVGKSILGTEAKNLIRPQTFGSAITTQVVRAVDLLKMRIHAYDRIKNTTQQTLRQIFDNVRVVTGETPSEENWLTYMPKTIYSFPGGIVCFNFKSEAPPENILITGDASANISVDGVTGDIYSCFVNLGDYELEDGNEVNIFCGDFSVKVHIRDIEPEITHLVFLNEWHCPEVFTCSGTLEIYPEKEQITANYFLNGKERREVLDSRLPENYRINTGFIYTQEERKWISKLLRSPKMWLWIEGKFVEVLCTNNQMRTYRTREHYSGYELNFEKAEK